MEGSQPSVWHEVRNRYENISILQQTELLLGGAGIDFCPDRNSSLPIDSADWAAYYHFTGRNSEKQYFRFDFTKAGEHNA